MPTAVDITEAAIDRINDTYNIAITLKDDALARMDALAAAAEAHLDDLALVAFSPSFGNLDTDYVAPTIIDTEPEILDEPDGFDLNADGDLTTSAPSAPSLGSLNSVSAFSYANTSYTPQLQSDTASLLTATLTGTGLLTDAEYTAIWDKAEADLARKQVADEFEASDAGARAGWSLPSETTLALLSLVTEGTTKAQADARLSQSLAEATQRREDKRAAITDGTQFENTWINEHNAEEGRKLDAAQATVAQSIAINTDILQQNAQLLQQYEILWQGIKHQTDVLLAQDDIKIRAFGARWAGIQTRIQSVSELWQARMRPAAQQIESERARNPFEGLALQKGLEVAKAESGLEVSKEQVILPQILGTLTSISQMISGLTQAALAAADVNVGTSAGWSYSESHPYNPI